VTHLRAVYCIAVAALLPLAACSSAPPAAHVMPKSFDVRTFGAVGDGKTKDTAALQKSLDACADAGGGEVIVPPGDYLTGSLHLHANTLIRLQKEAILHGSPDAADYPLIPIRYEGAAVQGHEALIYAEDADHIGIVGPGTLKGAEPLGSLRNPRGPTMVEFVNCDDIRLEEFSDRYRRMWSIHLLFCHHVLARNLNIRTTAANGDGIDAESTTDLHIDHCDIDTGDDAIALKSGRGLDGFHINKPTENVLITDCTLGSSFAGLAIGTEMSGGVRNVRLERCTFTHGANAIYIKSRTGRGGVIDNIDLSHLTATTSTFLGINLVNKGNAGTDPVPGDDGIPLARNIRVTDATVQCGTLLDGAHIDPAKPLDGLTLDNITGTCKKGISLQNVIHADLSNIHVTGFAGPLLRTDNVTGTGLEGAVQFVPATAPATQAKR
jgi:polygalacturonase